jgi:uncharacterized protein (DUF2336 family)
MLRRITALFVEGASRFNSQHVHVFGHVLTRLSADVDTPARVELARQLATMRNAPADLLRRLAHDDDIAVARPVLKQSQLKQKDLAEIAQSGSPAHLLALSKRKGISASVTDNLVQRAERDVRHGLAENLDAQLSPAALAVLIDRAAQDPALAEKVGMRPDIPPPLLRDLLLKTTRTVQRQLLASAKPEVQSEIRRVLSEVAGVDAAPRDYSAAERTMRELHEQGRLDEARIADFADRRQYEELVAGIARMCEVPVSVVERLMASDRLDPFLIVGKAAGWAWTTVRTIMAAAPQAGAKSSAEFDAAFANFERLSPTTAQRVMRFWQVQHWQHAPDAETSP